MGKPENYPRIETKDLRLACELIILPDLKVKIEKFLYIL